MARAQALELPPATANQVMQTNVDSGSPTGPGLPGFDPNPEAAQASVSDLAAKLRDLATEKQNAADEHPYYRAIGRALTGFGKGAQAALSIPGAGQSPWLAGAIGGISQAGPAFEEEAARREKLGAPERAAAELLTTEHLKTQAGLPAMRDTEKVKSQYRMGEIAAQSAERTKQVKQMQDLQNTDPLAFQKAVELVEKNPLSRLLSPDEKNSQIMQSFLQHRSILATPKGTPPAPAAPKADYKSFLK